MTLRNRMRPTLILLFLSGCLSVPADFAFPGLEFFTRCPDLWPFPDGTRYDCEHDDAVDQIADEPPQDGMCLDRLRAHNGYLEIWTNPHGLLGLHWQFSDPQQHPFRSFLIAATIGVGEGRETLFVRGELGGFQQTRTPVPEEPTWIHFNIFAVNPDRGPAELMDRDPLLRVIDHHASPWILHIVPAEPELMLPSRMLEKGETPNGPWYEPYGAGYGGKYPNGTAYAFVYDLDRLTQPALGGYWEPPEAQFAGLLGDSGCSEDRLLPLPPIFPSPEERP